MDTPEEKFFESLAKSGYAEHPRIDATPGVEVELAKAGNLASSSSAKAEGKKTSPLRSKASGAGARQSDPLPDLPCNSGQTGEPEGQLTLDVYQTPTEIVIESAIAGVKPEDIDINVSSDSVTIRGARHRDEEVKEENYIYQECYWGRFSRSVILPQEIDPENVEAKFKNGILTVKLPKVNRQKTKKIKVRME